MEIYQKQEHQKIFRVIVPLTQMLKTSYKLNSKDCSTSYNNFGVLGFWGFGVLGFWNYAMGTHVHENPI